MSQLCLTHTAFYLFLKHARSFLTEGFLKDGIKRLQWLWQPCRLKGNRGKEGEKMLKENETDTFISVDTELCRVALNCFVYEYGWWKGGRGEEECGNSLSNRHPCQVLQVTPRTSAGEVKYLPTTNVKFDLKHTTCSLCKKMTKMSSALARRMSLMVSHQNHCNLGLDSLH